MNPHREIAITGFGILACNGIGKTAFWDAIRVGQSGVRHIDRFDPSPYPCQIAGQLWDFNPEDFVRKSDIRRWHRHVHQSLAAARMSIEDSDLLSAGLDPERIGAAIGTSVGAPDEHYLKYREQFEKSGWRKINKFASSASSAHSSTVNVSVTFGLKGPGTTIASGCATGLEVIDWGVQQIQSDRADAVLVGATETPITAMTVAVSCSLGILSKRNDAPEKAMRPFDRDSDGLVLSEAAAALILERADIARARGANIYATIEGYGAAAEAHSPLTLDEEGEALSHAITKSLNTSGVTPRELDAAFCHGVSLPMYDRGESKAYKHALGEWAYRIPISATKSMVGQPYAAGGLMGVGAALLAFDDGTIAPTINLENPDPLCDLDFVAQRPRMNDVDTALVTAMSFGGTHNALVLRRRKLTGRTPKRTRDGTLDHIRILSAVSALLPWIGGAGRPAHAPPQIADPVRRPLHELGPLVARRTRRYPE